MRRLALAVLAAAILLAGCSAPVPTDEGADPLGWENGYWHNDTLDLNRSDGLNASEREAVISRAMARVELIRNLEFNRSVDITVVQQGNYSFGGGQPNASLRRFDNAKFEAAFLIGEDADSIGVQRSTRNATVGGYYDPGTRSIVIGASGENPELDGEGVLAHELTHALQDQHLNLSIRAGAQTRDGVNARLGLIEGDANVVQQAYLERCGAEWECLGDNGSAGGGGSGPANFGPYLLSIFPYSDGPGFVNALRDGDNWSAVNAAFADPPGSAQEIIEPASYGAFEAETVSLADRTSGGWERVRPSGRPDYATLGRSGLGAMIAHTLYDDYNQSALVAPTAFLNLDEDGELNGTDPLNYDFAATRGWQGDRLHVYHRGDDLAYVWRLSWESPAAAQRFADTYRDLLAHWGGARVSERRGIWVIEEGPYEDAFRVDVEGSRVTITNAPTRGELSEVRAP